ncbi:hypothetical protein [Paraburkholderia megapolitana]
MLKNRSKQQQRLATPAGLFCFVRRIFCIDPAPRDLTARRLSANAAG